MENETILDWKLDDGECSCYIWEWWIPRIDKFPYLGLAMRLVVLLLFEVNSRYLWWWYASGSFRDEIIFTI